MNRKILICGDVMFDKNLKGDCSRISPEAPVPIVDLDPNNISVSLGAAANVASHIANANVECILAYKACLDSSIDNSHEQFIKICNNKNIICNPLQFGNVIHPITVKERIWAGNQQVCRVDVEEKNKPDGKVEALWIKEIYKTINEHNIGCVIFSDYNKGTLTDSIIMNIAATCKEKKIPTILDPKRPTFYKIKNLNIIKPNNREISSTNKSAFEISMNISDTYLVHTKAKDGMDVYINGELNFQYPTLASESDVIDVCGAGDGCCAAMGIGLFYNANIESIIKFASKIAYFEVQHRGTYVPSQIEIEESINYAGISKY